MEFNHFPDVQYLEFQILVFINNRGEQYTFT